MFDYDFVKFRSVTTDIETSDAFIDFEKSRLINFGIDYLDDALVGISPNDLILIGGRSGAGKTELALAIAYQSAMQKKNTYYFALEAEKGELGMRLMYKRLTTNFYEMLKKEKSFSVMPVTYDRWVTGKLSQDFYGKSQNILSQLDDLSHLKIRYSNSDYSIDNFLADVEQIKDNAQLVVLDHLHYFDLNDSENENAQYKKIVKSIRSQCLDNNIPVILVSHIRKADPRMTMFVPEQEDFHGSSDIVKIATKAITIGGGGGKAVIMPDGTDYSPIGYVSFMKAVKHRRNGSATHKMAVTVFDNKINAYAKGYYLGCPAYDKDNKRMVFQVEESKFNPNWAERAARC